MKPQNQLLTLCLVLNLWCTADAQPFESLLTYRLHYHVPVTYDDPALAGAEKFTLLQHTADALVPIPVNISQRKMLLVTGMFLNRYNFSSLNGSETAEERSYTRIAFKGGINYQWKNDRHKTLLVALPTWASDDKLFDGNAFLMGALVVHSIAINDRLTVKAGFYYNREQWGNFWMPLAGVDWRLNNDWYIFGLLPGTFNVFKRVNNWFAFSFSERAPNGSLLDVLNDGNYVRIGRSTYVLFMFDLHFTPFQFQLMGVPSDITFTLSFGHSVFRSYELFAFGATDSDPKLEEGLFADVKSAPYVRLSVSVRAWD